MRRRGSTRGGTCWHDRARASAPAGAETACIRVTARASGRGYGRQPSGTVRQVMRVVAEIDGEGSFLVPDEALQRLAELCARLQAAIEQPDDAQLSRMLADVLNYVRAAGPAVPAAAASSAR